MRSLLVGIMLVVSVNVCAAGPLSQMANFVEDKSASAYSTTKEKVTEWRKPTPVPVQVKNTTQALVVWVVEGAVWGPNLKKEVRFLVENLPSAGLSDFREEINKIKNNLPTKTGQERARALLEEVAIYQK